MINLFPQYKGKNLLFTLFEKNVSEKYDPDTVNKFFRLANLGLQLRLDNVDELKELAIYLKSKEVKAILDNEAKIARAIRARRDLKQELLEQGENNFTFDLECQVIIQSDTVSDEDNLDNL